MNTETAVFGGGCFWCTEAVFQELRGVKSVLSGYAGGSTGSPQAAPTYENIGDHAEVVKIDFDPSQITYHDLLTVFFASHDPTTMNRQGADVGTQYRSIVLYTNEAQKREAEKFIKELDAVTELKPLGKFYEAEEYHRNYYRDNPDKPYCQIVINPKLEKIQKEFHDLLDRNRIRGL